MLSRLLKFDRLITPGIVRLLFYVLAAVLCLGFVVAAIGLLSTREAPAGLAILGIIGAFIGLLVSVVMLRISTELVLVVFMIRDELAWQRVNHAATSAIAP